MSVRRTNVDRVVQLLRYGPASRAVIGERTGLSRATVSGIVNDLIRSGIATSGPMVGTRNEGAGRPTQVVALAEHSVRSVGVEFRWGDLFVGIADPLHQVVATSHHRHRRGLNWRDRAEIAIEELRALCRESGIQSFAPQGIGVGVPGPVTNDPLEGTWRPAIRLLGEEFRAPVYVENNLRLRALVEASAGSESRSETVVYFHVEDGIGGGIVIGGQVYRGANGAAGDFGHVTVAPATKPCRCGRSGCLEQVANLPALLKRAGVSRGDRTTAELARLPELREELERCATLCGRVIGEQINALDVSHLILGGILAHLDDHALALFTDEVNKRIQLPTAATIRISRSTLADDAGVRGGIALVRHATGAPSALMPFTVRPAIAAPESTTVA
ncbi:ROK family transcriptional regulator [Humibacter albus]|uniref:ROK family transcriptional regulator n=1 Tax=Humibacter albus TaxID=427754 RepID=UPI00040A85D1|nr:ROK family transcriptional regulator [Humibacter albus]